MQLSSLLTLAFAVTSFASAHTKRDGAQIVSDFGVVTTKLVALNDSITSFTGTAAQGLDVQSKSSAVLKQLQATTSDANASAAFTEDESYAIGNAVADLTPQVDSTLDNLVSKKATFTSAGFTSVVVSQLKSQRSATSDLSAAIVAKVPSDLQQAAGQFVQPILDKFDSTLKAYGA